TPGSSRARGRRADGRESCTALPDLLEARRLDLRASAREVAPGARRGLVGAAAPALRPRRRRAEPADPVRLLRGRLRVRAQRRRPAWHAQAAAARPDCARGVLDRRQRLLHLWLDPRAPRRPALARERAHL